ncbi:hypothetical protein HY497_01080 [Candidatus Woesearchaeota archaeon]|nr:hypothetical protein [Candidatus Woesearchaeota archaeon]
MKLLLAGAVATLAGAVGYGSFKYDTMERRVHDVAQRQIQIQSHRAELVSLLRPDSEIADVLDEASTIPTEQLADKIIAVAQGRGRALADRLRQSDQEAQTYRELARAVQGHIQDLSVEVAGYSAVLSQLEREIDGLFRERIAARYSEMQEKIRTTHEVARRTNSQRHIIYATDDVLLEALRTRDTLTLYLLHLSDPAQASRLTFNNDIARLKKLCELIDMGPDMVAHYNFTDLGSGQDGQESRYYAIGYPSDFRPNPPFYPLSDKDTFTVGIFSAELPDGRWIIKKFSSARESEKVPMK